MNNVIKISSYLEDKKDTFPKDEGFDENGELNINTKGHVLKYKSSECGNVMGTEFFLITVHGYQMEVYVSTFLNVATGEKKRGFAADMTPGQDYDFSLQTLRDMVAIAIHRIKQRHFMY